MSFWDRWARESRLALAIGLLGTLAVPVVGILILRFLLSGPEVDAVASQRSVPPPIVVRPGVADPGPVPTVLAPSPPQTPAPATPAATPIPTPTPSPTPSRTGEVNATDGLNVRTEPSTQGRVLRILPFETRVDLTGRSRQSEGLTWVELEAGGWVQERYLDRR
ncbi:MAG: SH3 domain-containing protein [Chloroflexi bacterium]|nr:SH3 domain-containing protein [Chloroflexota bacterium]